jgi:vesicle coat complex subunit
MNLLEDSLKVSNSAVVLAATKCFLNLTADLPEIRAQVRESHRISSVSPFTRAAVLLFVILCCSYAAARALNCLSLLVSWGVTAIPFQVYYRLKTPLLTLMASALPEVSFCVLSHIEPLVKRCPGVFDDEFKQFYCRFNEPTSVKHIKMDLLPLVANDSNTAEIVAELAEYVSDVNAEMARHAIRSIAQVHVVGVVRRGHRC